MQRMLLTLLAAVLLLSPVPAIAQIDGGPGIARRVAHLTQGQDWPKRPRGMAVFTGSTPRGLETALAEFGLDTISRL